jgi:hypothetical protein
MEATLAALGNRVFLMNNVHEDAPVVFESRWAMSYLCGPLTKGQIKTLMDPVRPKHPSAAAAAAAGNGADAGEAPSAGAPPAKPRGASSSGPGSRPVVPAGINEKFLAISGRVPDGYRLEYRPGLTGKGKMHFVRRPDGIDVWRTCYLLQSIKDAPLDDIWQGASISDAAATTDDAPDSQGHFAELPAELSRDKSYAIFLKQLKEHLYREGHLTLHQCDAMDEMSKPEESESDFRKRLQPLASQKLAYKRTEIENKFAKKINEAQSRAKKLKSQAGLFGRFFRMLPSLWVIIDNALSKKGINLPGRRRSLGTAVSTVGTEFGRSSDAKHDAELAEQNLQQQKKEREDELKAWEAKLNVAGLAITPFEIKPQKGDVEADEVSLVWLPYRISPAGTAEPVYEIPNS